MIIIVAVSETNAQYPSINEIKEYITKDPFEDGLTLEGTVEIVGCTKYWCDVPVPMAKELSSRYPNAVDDLCVEYGDDDEDD